MLSKFERVTRSIWTRTGRTCSLLAELTRNVPSFDELQLPRMDPTSSTSTMALICFLLDHTVNTLILLHCPLKDTVNSLTGPRTSCQTLHISQKHGLCSCYSPRTGHFCHMEVLERYTPHSEEHALRSLSPKSRSARITTFHSLPGVLSGSARCT